MYNFVCLLKEIETTFQLELYLFTIESSYVLVESMYVGDFCYIFYYLFVCAFYTLLGAKGRRLNVGVSMRNSPV